MYIEGGKVGKEAYYSTVGYHTEAVDEADENVVCL